MILGMIFNRTQKTLFSIMQENQTVMIIDQSLKIY